MQRMQMIKRSEKVSFKNYPVSYSTFEFFLKSL